MVLDDLVLGPGEGEAVAQALEPVPAAAGLDDPGRGGQGLDHLGVVELGALAVVAEHGAAVGPDPHGQELGDLGVDVDQVGRVAAGHRGAELLLVEPALGDLDLHLRKGLLEGVDLGGS
jgi:hypothetical protein